MGKRRGKQHDLDTAIVHPAKRVKVRDQGWGTRGTNKNGSSLSRTLLPLYYKRVVSLRQFLLSRLPSSSKFRHRRLVKYGLDQPASRNGSHFLDTTVVGILGETAVAVEEERRRDFLNFAQSQQKSAHGSARSTQPHEIAEVSHVLSLETPTPRARSYSR